MTLIDYIKSAERWQRYGEHYHDEGVTYYAELNRAVLTISTFLLGFIGIFLQIGNIEEEAICGKLLIATGFFSLVISIIFGLCLFRYMNDFLNKAGDYYEQLSSNLYEWMFNNKESGPSYPEEIYKGLKLEIQGNNRLSNFQLLFFCVGLIAVTVYFIFRLFY